MRVLLACIAMASVMLPALAGAALSAPAVARGASPNAETPEHFVRRAYARYGHNGPAVSTERPAGAAFYSAALLDAFAKEAEAAHGEVGAIDGDPLCQCQDYDRLRVTSVTVASRTADTVDARVTFFNLKARTSVVLTLARTGDEWRVADVSSKDMKSLMALLQDSIAHPDVAPSATEVSPTPAKP